MDLTLRDITLALACAGLLLVSGVQDSGAEPRQSAPEPAPDPVATASPDACGLVGNTTDEPERAAETWSIRGVGLDADVASMREICGRLGGEIHEVEDALALQPEVRLTTVRCLRPGGDAFSRKDLVFSASVADGKAFHVTSLICRWSASGEEVPAPSPMAQRASGSYWWRADRHHVLHLTSAQIESEPRIETLTLDDLERFASVAGDSAAREAWTQATDLPW